MTISAKYPGTCSRCGRPINPGDKIEWERGFRPYHTKCPAQTAKTASTEPAPISVSRGEGYGGRPYQVGQIVTRKGAGGQPEHLVVVRAASRYYREDGMSFGVGDEQGRVYYADCRLATEAEWRPVVEAREKAQAEAAEKARQAKEAEAARDAVYNAAKAAIPAEYIASMSVAIPTVEEVEVVASDPSGWYRRTLKRGTLGGQVVYVEEATGADDWRTYLIAPPSIMEPLIDAEIDRAGITREKAEEFLAKYSGCVGAEIYRRALAR